MSDIGLPEAFLPRRPDEMRESGLPATYRQGWRLGYNDALQATGASDLLEALRNLHAAMKDSRDRGLYWDEMDAAEAAIHRATTQEATT